MYLQVGIGKAKEGQGMPTYAKKLENGRPLSRANTQMRRETEAKMLNSARKKIMASIEISTLAAVFEPVTL